jgi:predicted O-methyltransferase YrrM
MDEALRRRLDALLAQGRSHDAAEVDRRRRLRNVEPETAELLALLATALGARSVLEIGTSNGYSTIWLADAVRPAGGRVTTLEIDAGRADEARANLAGAGLADVAQVVVGDAARVLAGSRAGSFNLVFLDAEREAYVSYWPELVRVLARPGLLVVDNVLSHAAEVSEFRALVEADGRVRATVAPVGAGLLLAATSRGQDDDAER